MKKASILLALAATLLGMGCKKDNNSATATYQLVADSSVAVWKGYLRTGYFNEGSIGVQSEPFEVSQGLPKSGRFTMPLSGLKNFNLPTEELQEQLIHHLQGPDFFNMALHPNITFDLSRLTNYTGGVPDAVDHANYTVTGKLSLLGQPLDISFPARISSKGNSLYVTAKLKVDRTRWGINYAADTTLPDEQYILPQIDIDLNLKAVRKE